MHHCARCGADMTRVRAVRDAVYGLAVVRCPACGLGAVRRRHPVLVWTRRVCRLVPVAWVLVAHALLMPIATFGYVGMAAVTSEEIMQLAWRRDGTLAPGVVGVFIDRAINHPEELFIHIGMACTAGLAGLWMGLFLHHWRRGALFGVWLAFELAYVGLDVLCARVSALAWFLKPVFGTPWAKTPLHGAMWAGVIAVSSLIVLVFAAIGGSAARGLQKRRSARWRRRLAKLRKG